MTPNRSTAKVVIQKVNGAAVERQPDWVAVEEPLEIKLSFEVSGRRTEQSVSITMRTPGEDFELAAGFLYGEGIVKSADEIQQITYCVGSEKEKQQYNVLTVRLSPRVAFDPERLARHFYTTSSCGVCGKASLELLRVQGAAPLPAGRPILAKDLIPRLPERLVKDQAVFGKTGGLHAAGLFDASGALIALHEDVGRHNAVDRLVGTQLMARKLPLHDSAMVVSGRASFEIMQKALMAGIPVVAAVGAPSSLAVDVAREFGMTLLGFVRGDRFNVYTGEERIR